MEWRDEGIILGTRQHGETSAILEVMTRGRGRHMGLVRGGRSRRLRPFLQPGNRIDIAWRARLDEHLGTFQVEPIEQNAARLFGSATAVFALQTLAAHLRLLPERDPHLRLYETLLVVIRHLDDPLLAGELVARFEVLVLDELGFGLDLDQCGATGVRANLIYVSPKTGRAVSGEAGAPWAERLLALPAFLNRSSGSSTAQRGDSEAIFSAFRLTGHFLSRHVYEPRGMLAPEARAGFLSALAREIDKHEQAEGESA
jgi:DNA repair protein RecO (recombination protein O)